MDYSNVREFKRIVEGFMRYHNLRGMEMIMPYYQDATIFRACGKGMVRPEGTPLAGVELWLSLNDVLRQEDKAEEICQMIV